MKCEDCPIRDLCAGDSEALAERIVMDHARALLALTELGEESGASAYVITAGAFLAGYFAAVKDQESPQVDMDVWGECFDDKG